jgi:ankyrin repeat protein
LCKETELKIHKKVKTQKSLFSLLKESSSRKRYEIIGKYLIANNADMELKNINPNGDNVVAININNIKFLIFE